MEVYPVGSEVNIGGTTAMILVIQIAGTGVMYKVAWWVERDRKESWVEACEVSGPAPKEKIGFLNA